MQSGRSPSPIRDNSKMKRHRPALVLWALFVASFLLVVLLYVKFSGPFLLSVFETMQVHRAQIEGRTVNQAIVDYDDYLRVDPESIRVRGLIVNAFIEKQAFRKAEEHATRALELATEKQRSLSGLIAARVYLAKGDVGKAAPHVQSVLDTTPNSGEGHYQMAQLHLALGQVEDAEREFARVGILGPKDSTAEYIEEWNTRSQKIAGYQREIESGVKSAQRLYELGMEFQKMGRLDEARVLFSNIETGPEVQPRSKNAFEIAATAGTGSDPA